MKLHSVKISGYKRFADASINLAGNVVAIVGPNEAGKSSLLDALTLLNTDDPIPAPARTRGANVKDETEVLRARFRLDDDDRAEAPFPLPPNQGSWLLVSKIAAGPRRLSLDPPVARPRGTREAAVATAVRESSQPWYQAWKERNEPAVSSVDAARQALESGPETLTRESLQVLDQAIGHLRDFPSSESRTTHQKAAAKLLTAYQEAKRVERLDSPDDFAESFRAEIPKFVLFGQADRELQSEYNLDNPPAPKEAWANLARLGGVKLNQLRAAIRAQNSGEVQTMVQGLQRRAREALNAGWRQSHLAIVIDREGPILKIVVTSDESERNFFALHERSDGVRAYIALRAFLAKSQPSYPPILLVDEAETHLHYAAQADLVELFEKMPDVASVIYTTHSVGCLPQDLGRGVRVVLPDPKTGQSVIDNYWSRKAPGISPLVHAMGGRAIGLTPSRHVVMTEGASDVFLLPTLLREATRLRSLPYQVVGGLSSSKADIVRDLTLEAPRVAFVIDGDSGRSALMAKLRRAGIDEAKVVPLPDGLSLEDLLQPELYCRAVNRYLQAWGDTGGLTTSDLPSAGRRRALKAWCKKRGIDDPSPMHVAQSLLGLLDDDPSLDIGWVEPRHRETLQGLHAKLCEALGLDPAEVTEAADVAAGANTD